MDSFYAEYVQRFAGKKIMQYFSEKNDAKRRDSTTICMGLPGYAIHVRNSVRLEILKDQICHVNDSS